MVNGDLNLLLGVSDLKFKSINILFNFISRKFTLFPKLTKMRNSVCNLKAGDKIYLNGIFNGERLVNKEATIIHPDVPKFLDFDVILVIEYGYQQFRIHGTVYNDRINHVALWPREWIRIPCERLTATAQELVGPFWVDGEWIENGIPALSGQYFDSVEEYVAFMNELK